jgi:hypothetical protein
VAVEETSSGSALFAPMEEETSEAYALTLIHSGILPTPDSIQKLAWLALGEQKFSAAVHLARFASGDGADDSLFMFAARIRAMVLGQAIRNPIGSIADQLKIDYASIANALDADSDQLALAFRLMMISSALRPAVLAPDTNAKAIIELGSRSLPRLDRLYWLCTQLADYANLKMPLDATALEYIDRSVNYAQNIVEFQTEASAWWARAPQLNFKYAPALKLWKLWLETDGHVGHLIMPILRNDRSALEEVRRLTERLSTDAKIRDEIKGEEKRLRSHGFDGTINWNVLSVFTRHVRDAVDYANRWIALQEHTSSDQLDYRRKRLLELRMKLDSAHNELKAELALAAANATDMRVAVALQLCQDSINNLIELMHPKVGHNTGEPQIRYLLSSDLLLVPDLPMNNEWEPTIKTESLLRLLLSILSNPSSHALETALGVLGDNCRNHEAVDRIIEYLSWEGKHPKLLEQLSTLQDAHLKQCQAALARQIEDCTHRIEIGVTLGLVRDYERAEYLDTINQISKRISSVRNFEAEEAALGRILDAIENSRMRQVEQVQARIKAEGIYQDSPSYPRIQAAIERGDVDTANEYIDLTLRGDNIPDQQEVPDVFRSFFPKAASAIDEYLSVQGLNPLITNIETQKGIPGVEMKQVPGAQVQEAVTMLEAWAALKKTKRAKTEHLKTLFERLGFSVLRLSEATSTPRAFLLMEVTPLKHRDQCPIPYFGSVYHGHYRVICIWDRPSDEDILTTVRQGRQGDPAIVLYFGRLTEQKRRSIAQLSRSDNLNFILIDELLVSYLCGERGSRLPVMFDCALPFTFINPYITTSSIVPPEMFYGRRGERDQISDPMGSCFVYGGRQLGKTALLLSIKDDFHNPVEHRVALWIDLKSYGDDIWTVLSRAFKGLPDVDLQIGDARSEQKLLDRLQAWLQVNNKRRILLLLDEADRFLESDSDDSFRRTSSLKGLMERTNRRFKVVFAGLHNVQRTTKQQNHPLAHFGEPICVGPLLDHGEWKEAKALIEKPFWSLGFRFESPDLVTRILSRTNYYPSLIQLYCNQIYQSLKLDTACLRNGPPYVITAKHVEDAYFSRQFENAIREKFELTLNLDPRYRVLALIIALNSLQGLSNSMCVANIREQAFNWWQLGFCESRTEEDFRVLLEEMLGLGILREVNNEFALRTPNLLSLLGSLEQIEQKLVQSSYDAPPPPYAAHVHRTSDRKYNWRRNPLSDQQESELRSERHSVTIIYGTKAAGVDDVEHFLSQAFESTHFKTCDLAVSDRHAFHKYLEEVRAQIQIGTTLVFVRHSPWTAAWIEEAVAMSKGRTRFTSIVFLADPEATWRLIQDRPVLEPLVADRKVNTISLQPWHSNVLWEWLGDCGIGSNAVDEQKEIGARTGRWPLILQDFRAAIVSGGKGWKAAIEEISDRVRHDPYRSAYLDAFGLNVPVPRTVLSEMASLGCPVLIDDLAELIGNLSKVWISDAIYWADRLGLVQPAGGGEWQLDPIVKDVLINGAKVNELVDAPGTV